jgi:hypothetical protein
MDAALRERTREAMAQTDAIFALEGFEPRPETRVINAAVLDGRVTFAQVIAEVCDYVREHKTMNGFIESRSWA